MSRSKAKGTSAESAVVNYLREWAPFVERRALQGSKDTGDINLGNGASVVIEVKNHAQVKLAEFVDEAVAEGDNANADVAVAWIKRTRKSSPADWYVVMTGTQFVSLLLDAGYLAGPREEAS